MLASGELGKIRVGRKLRKLVPRPIKKVFKVVAPLTPAVLVSKTARAKLRKMVPKPVRAIARRVAPVIAPSTLIFKAQRGTATKALKSLSPKARKVAAIAAGATAATGVAIALSQSEKAEAVEALVDQGMSPGAAGQAVEQAAAGGGAEEEPKPEPAAGEEKPVVTAGVGGGLVFPLVLVGGVVAFVMYGQPKKRRR